MQMRTLFTVPVAGLPRYFAAGVPVPTAVLGCLLQLPCCPPDDLQLLEQRAQASGQLRHRQLKPQQNLENHAVLLAKYVWQRGYIKPSDTNKCCTRQLTVINV